MRFALICVVMLVVTVSFGFAQQAPTAASETVAEAPEEVCPSGPTPEELPPYVSAPTAEPLQPVRKAPPRKLTVPPIAQPPAPTPQPPVHPTVPTVPAIPRPKFNREASPALTLVYPAHGGSIDEGNGELVWNTGGPIAYVRLSYTGENCALGGHPRGTFTATLGKVINKGTFKWQAPWVDAPELKVNLVGYGLNGKQLAMAEVTYQFHPKILQGKPDTCIVVSKARQRLWYLKDGVIKRMHVISTAATGFYTPSMRPGSRDPSRGEMGRIFCKALAPKSHEYDVIMPYWLQITASGSHGIHATSPPFYHALGQPASHGCVRQHKEDARILWEMVRVGTPVYVQ